MIKIKNHLLAITVLSSGLFSVCNLSHAGAEEWEKEKDKNGIVVYTRETSSGFDSFKGVTIVDAEINEALGILRDLENHKDWLYQCEDAKMLERLGDDDSNIIVYQENNMPWPVTDRDIVLKSVTTQDADTLTVTVTLTNQPDFIPENEDLVRIPSAQGYWKFEPTGRPGRTKVTYELAIDPGGSLPAWLVNSLVVDLPFESLEKFSEIAEENRPEYVKADFSKEGLVMPTYE